MKIHKYRQCGLNIVIDVNSGAIHIVDDVVYDILDNYEASSVEEIRASLKDKYSEEEQ